MKKNFIVCGKSFLILVLAQSLFATSPGAVAPIGGGGGGNPQKIIRDNIAEGEGNLKKCKAYLVEIREINRKSREIIEHFDLTVYNSRLEHIKKDIKAIENELKQEQNPQKRAEMQKDIQTIKAVDAELRKKK